MSGDEHRAAAAFASGDLSVAPVPGGLINDTYLVVGGADELILQRLNPSVFGDADAVMANILTITARLEGAIVPRPRRTLEGPWTVVIGGATWRGWDRVVDAAPVDAPNLERVGSAARLIARFHDAMSDIDPGDLEATLPHFHEPAWHLGRFERAVEDDPVGRVGSATDVIDAILAHGDLAAVSSALIAEHGPAVAHNDTKLANFLFRDDEAVCLLDLDTVMPTAQFWDVADLVRSAGHHAAEDDPDPVGHRGDADLIGAILAGYRSVRPAGDELETGCVLIAYEQVLRFLTDWIQGDHYWKTTSPVQNLNRARGQLALLVSLRELFGI